MSLIIFYRETVACERGGMCAKGEKIFQSRLPQVVFSNPTTQIFVFFNRLHEGFLQVVGLTFFNLLLSFISTQWERTPPPIFTILFTKYEEKDGAGGERLTYSS